MISTASIENTSFLLIILAAFTLLWPPAIYANQPHLCFTLSNFELKNFPALRRNRLLQSFQSTPNIQVSLATRRKQSEYKFSKTEVRYGTDPNTHQQYSDAISSVRYNVVYQKVLRASNNEASHTFLLDLVTYLQSIELPNGLPMPYETKIPDQNDADDYSDNRAILIIDSPLANSPCDARLEVEVIGIVPDAEDDKDEENPRFYPKMAMVALKKLKKSKDKENSVTEGLFKASEKRIIQIIDRGLQDFEEGRISIPSSLSSGECETASMGVIDEFDDLSDDGIDAAIKRMGYQNTINAAAIDTDVISKVESKSKHNFIKDPLTSVIVQKDDFGQVVLESKELLTQGSTMSVRTVRDVQKTAPARETIDPDRRSIMTNVSHTFISKTKQNPKLMKGNEADDDYAITMARNQAELLMKTVKRGSATSTSKGAFTITGGESDFAILAAKKLAKLQNIKGKNDKFEKYDGKFHTASPDNLVSKGQMQNLSNDKTFIKLQSIAKQAKQKSWNKTISKMGKTDKVEDIIHSGVADNTLINVKTSEDKKELSSPIPIHKSNDQIQYDITQVSHNDKKIQDFLKSATDMMPIEEEEDLTPEEILTRVLKFGDLKEKEERTGFGFVEGARQKAKDLLQSSQGSEVHCKEYKFKEIDSDNDIKQKQEEELRRIFTTGQSMALDRILSPRMETTDLSKSSVTDDEIEALIEADVTVPRNARILDDELAEWEVRVSRSQGEESDGKSKRNIFDVFSGPELYNPNVDVETAVNWPGAKRGTRTDILLASELESAVEQAKFASNVLTRMSVVENDDGVHYFVGEKELTIERVMKLRNCVNLAVKAGIIENPEDLLVESNQFKILIDEVLSQPEERLQEIALNYKDLLLSDNFIELMRQRLHVMAQHDLAAQKDETECPLKDKHTRERAIMINLAQIAQGLIREAQALGAELEVSMLEIIRSICEVAMDPAHKTEEETAIALSDAVRDMRPLLDDAFVAYLKYAIAEEEGKLARMGLLDDPEHNRWLFVLKIVQEGVYVELSHGVKRYIDHISYVLRMQTKAERKELLKKLIDVMPTMDVRPFVKVVSNIVSSLGMTVKGEFAEGVVLGEMTNKLLQLQRDVDDLLPPERIKEMSKEADAWALIQRQRLLERQNSTRQRLHAARQTGGFDVDKELKKNDAEYDRFD